MSRPPRVSAALLIASVVVGCDPIAPAEVEWDSIERMAEREALTAFYISTDGDNWTDKAGWLVRADPCRWFGVTCSGGQVFQILMESNNLTGTIPAELGSLTALSDLRLNSNNMTGTIPAELGNLTTLSILNFSDNSLTGALPAELGNLAALATLLLDSNALSGFVPLPIAVMGGKIQQVDRGRCGFESNPGLSMPDVQDYMDADLDNDGFICGIPLSTPSP